MSCEVAAIPFQADANYGTWSIDFVKNPPLTHVKVLLLILPQHIFFWSETDKKTFNDQTYFLLSPIFILLLDKK